MKKPLLLVLPKGRFWVPSEHLAYRQCSATQLAQHPRESNTALLLLFVVVAAFIDIDVASCGGIHCHRCLLTGHLSPLVWALEVSFAW